MTGVPSHWVPLYGDCHGAFYDPATSMIVGDGPPRCTLERHDTILPAQSYELQFAESMNYPGHMWADADFHHVQPNAAFTAIHMDAPFQGPGIRLFFCTCINRWLPTQHNCYISPDLPYPSGAIVPRQRLPPDWVDRDIPAVDTGYLETNMVCDLKSGP